jgi:integrase
MKLELKDAVVRSIRPSKKLELTDAVVRSLRPPRKGLLLVRDALLKGFGVRVLRSGVRSYVLDYSRFGRRHLYTIGQAGAGGWQCKAAREHAKVLQHRIRYENHDPAGELKAGREAPTLADLAERFQKEHMPRLRPSTQRDYERIITKTLVPQLGDRKLADIHFADVDSLHRKITAGGSPVAANLTVSLLRKMFSMAIKWRLIETNPARGIERNPVSSRQRYLSVAEIQRLTTALAEHSNQVAANAIRLLLFTGARRSEVLGAEWSQFDLDQSQWVKPATGTKQKRTHNAPLNAPALELLTRLRTERDSELRRLDKEVARAKPADRRALVQQRKLVETYLFPATFGESKHLTEIKKSWKSLCLKAGLYDTQEGVDERTGQPKMVKVPNIRLHDLRHSFASVLASSGASLLIIGKLLGHTQSQTTARYSHLHDDPLRKASETAGAILAGKPSGEVVPLRPKGAAV